MKRGGLSPFSFSKKFVKDFTKNLDDIRLKNIFLDIFRNLVYNLDILKRNEVSKMVVIAVLCILSAGLACAGMSFVGAYSFIKSHDWHYGVGAGMYALGAVFFIGWVFSMSW